MGLSSKQVSGDEGLDWVQTLSGAAELPKQPPTRRQQQPIRQQPEPALKCPRCGSSNTKFCYYNNYNKSQPRHFCKSCKRHWTKGGTLRNVPVGGVRKNKRPKTSSSPTRHPKFPMIADDATRDDHNSMPGILYQAFVSTSSPLILQETTTPLPNATAGLISASSSSAPQNNIQNANEFQFSSLNPFEDSASWMNPTSYLSLSNAYDHDHYTRNLDSVDDSTVTTVDIPGTSSGPWPGLDTSGVLDLPSYWNWNEIDVLTPSDPSVAWDGHDDNAEIKP